MELQSISQVSRQLGISTRTLRYYEQIGLIGSSRKEDFAYRVYDEDTVLRLQQVIVLRRLRIPLGQIAQILRSGEAAVAIATFQRNLNEIDDEIAALSTIRSILQAFIRRLDLPDAELQLLDDESLLEIVDSLTVTKNNFREEKTMDDLNRANETLSKYAEVRIVRVPPMTVACAHFVGPDAEGGADKMVFKFAKDVDLLSKKSDVRIFGFNHDENGTHGYEFWVSIPDGMEVPAPVEKRHFAGGLYGVHTSYPVHFEEWRVVYNWVGNNEAFDYDRREPLGMDGCLEEHFNYFNEFGLQNPTRNKLLYIDFMIPVKEKG